MLFKKGTLSFSGCSSDISSSYLSVQVKCGACYITGQWGEFRIKYKKPKPNPNP